MALSVQEYGKSQILDFSMTGLTRLWATHASVRRNAKQQFIKQVETGIQGLDLKRISSNMARRTREFI